jgi:hypothetical protein
MSGPGRQLKGDHKDVAGGAFIALIGGLALWKAVGYRIGTPQQMGPGYFPMVISALMIVVGLGIAVSGLRRSGEIEMPAFRPTLATFASILVFGLCIRNFGLIPAMFATTVIAAAGDRNWSPIPTLVLGASMGVGAWILFVKLLGLSMTPFAWPF